MKSEAYWLLRLALDGLRAGESEQALGALHAALEAAKSEEPPVLATVARSAAVAYEFHGRLADAEAALEAAAVCDPRDGLTALALAGVKHRRGSLDGARVELRRAEKIAEETGDQELQAMIEHYGRGPGATM